MRGPVAIIAGDFTPWGGMDRPNYELAWFLAEQRGVEVHLVSHRVASPLSGHPRVIWHRVWRPFGRHALGSLLLDRRGRKVARAIDRVGGTVIVNGANCLWPDVNWIHYVHNATAFDHERPPFLRRQRLRLSRHRDRMRERLAVLQARVIIADSVRASELLIAGTGADPGRIRAIYYGVDADVFCPASTAERLAAREALGLPPDQPVVAFIGGLGRDRRKGFDVLFDAWSSCCRDKKWDALLVVAGTGPELPYWERRVLESGLGDRIRMLGFCKEISTVLSAADCLVSPTRFEPYGQGVHEAICCGLPAFVSRCAGISERYPVELEDLLLDESPEASQLQGKLRTWRDDVEGHRQRVIPFSEQLRGRTWSDMSAEIVAAIEADR